MSKSSTNHTEATSQMVLRPQLAPQGKSFDHWITATSPKWQRIAAVQMTRYLSLEAGVRQDLVEGKASWLECRTAILTVTEEFPMKNGDERQGLVGILTFHQFDLNPILYHCYLHPFFRGKGLMAEAWKQAQTRYPQFEIEEPLSPAMRSFLTKVDSSPILPST